MAGISDLHHITAEGLALRLRIYAIAPTLLPMNVQQIFPSTSFLVRLLRTQRHSSSADVVRQNATARAYHSS